MKLKNPRRKKYCKFEETEPFPITNISDDIQKLTGRFNGFTVVITDPNDINNLNSKGFFGKGNLSKSFPNYNTQLEPVFLRKRVHELRKLWNEKYEIGNLNRPVILVEDTDSENDDFIKQSNPKLAESPLINETLNLNLEEAYFLMSALKCLNIYDINSQLLDANSAWKLFADTQENFIQNYVIYYYFRCRNWIVKTGLKFGCDFLLYKKGPPFFHASYVVIIDFVNKENNPVTTSKSLEWSSLIGLNRLTETAAKEILICQVTLPLNKTIEVVKSSPETLKLFTVNPILMRRWIPKQERKSKNVK